MIFLNAFIVGGLICGIGQIIIDLFKLTPGHVTGIYVVVGVLLDSFGIYDFLIKVSGAGALLPITSFGHSLIHSAMEGSKSMGVMGIFSNIFDKTSFGISLAIVLSMVLALIFKPKN